MTLNHSILRAISRAAARPHLYRPAYLLSLAHHADRFGLDADAAKLRAAATPTLCHWHTHPTAQPA